uniref:Uncharacterized protein n=1 Tax=Rangifer tarandus platyrhynchus TaxID=3082113 RepID=A0ACB0FHJ3_RANTA|nr:unnamed protein product [Rangifer tarandus platyrhynchus]
MLISEAEAWFPTLRVPALLSNLRSPLGDRLKLQFSCNKWLHSHGSLSGAGAHCILLAPQNVVGVEARVSGASGVSGASVVLGATGVSGAAVV